MSFQQPKEGNGSHNPTPAPTDVQTQPQSTPTQYPSPFSPTGNVLDTYSELPAGEQPILGVPSAYSYPFFVSPQDSSPNAVPVDGGHPSGPLGAVEAARTPPKRTAEAPVRPFSRHVLTEWNDESGPTRVRASRHRHHQDSPRNDSDSPRSASGDDEDHRKKALGFAPMEPHPPPPVSNRSSRPMSLQCSGEGFVQRRRSMMMDHLVYDDEEYVADEPDALRRESLEHQRHRALLSEDPSEDDVADLSTHLDEKHHAKTRRDTTVVYDREGNPDMVDGLTFFRQLGSGASGTVWHCLDTTADQERAVKAIPRNKCGRSRLAALPEVAVMKSLHHHHIVRLYECIDDPKHPTVYLVMQFVNGGAVSTMASDGTCAPIDLKDLAHVLQGVTSALIHCHRLGIVHGDVKPDNILVERHGGKVHSYLADFGVSMACYKKPVDACDSVCHGTVEDFLRAVGELSDGGGDTLSNDSSSRAATFGLRGPGALGGTPAFLAPEVLCGQERTPASDMWALGVTIYALIFGHLPFPVTPECTLATLKKLVCEGDPMFPPEATTSPMLRRWKMVIKQLMQKDPALRLTAVALSRCKLLYPHTYAAMTFASSNDFDDHHNPLSTAPSIISELSTSASILSGSNLSSFIAGVDMASSSSSRQQLLSSLRAQSLRATNE